MNTRNKLRLIMPFITFGVLVTSILLSNGMFNLAVVSFGTLFAFYTIRYVKQYRQVEIEGTSKSFEDSTV